jgi:hypothetical protein
MMNSQDPGSASAACLRLWLAAWTAIETCRITGIFI